MCNMDEQKNAKESTKESADGKKKFRHLTLEERAIPYGGKLNLSEGFDRGNPTGGEYDWGDPVGEKYW